MQPNPLYRIGAEAVREMLERAPWAQLVSHPASGPVASPSPVLLAPEDPGGDDERIVLETHLGRADARLHGLLHGFLEEYAGSRDKHRVLTEDVKFLQPQDRERVLDKERAVVADFARALAEMRPDVETAGLAKALTMLLFGMINWMFTWLRPDGELDYETMAPVVADLFFGGVPAVRLPDARSGAPQ